ncbi:MAG: phosphatase PAP2 family protein [Myxococcota bacterium]|jgi:membrane-associated phospholipid phosphatase
MTRSGIARFLEKYMRPGFLFYLIGIVTASQLVFISESYFPAKYGVFPKPLFEMIVTVIIPGAFVAGGFLFMRGKGFWGLKIDKMFAPREDFESRTLLQRYDWLILAVVMLLLWCCGYWVVEYLARDQQMHTMEVDLDRRILFNPTYVWFYITVYPFYLIPFFAMNDKRLAKMVMFSYITILLSCDVFYLFYPVLFPRDSLVVNSFSTWVLSIVHAGDKPWNCFPSSHCAMSLMAALVLFEINPWFGVWGLAGAFWIGISTVFLKQHYVVDVVAGFGLTMIVYYAYFKGRIIEILNRKQQELYSRVGSAIEDRIEDVVRKVVREELARMNLEARQQDKARSNPGVSTPPNRESFL